MLPRLQGAVFGYRRTGIEKGLWAQEGKKKPRKPDAINQKGQGGTEQRLAQGEVCKAKCRFVGRIQLWITEKHLTVGAPTRGNTAVNGRGTKNLVTPPDPEKKRESAKKKC